MITTVPVLNPAGCPSMEYGYATLSTDPGCRLYHDMLRDALAYDYTVKILPSWTPGDCAYGKPRLIAVFVATPRRRYLLQAWQAPVWAGQYRRLNPPERSTER
jgi:hypothetical protein